MQKFHKISFSLFVLMQSMFIVSCDRDTNDHQETAAKQEAQDFRTEFVSNLSDADREKFDVNQVDLSDNSSDRITLRASIDYLGELCSDEVTEGTHVDGGSPFSSEDWQYYYFSGNAGDDITILVQRTTPDLDPNAYLFEGLYSDTGDLGSGDELIYADDNSSDPFGSCYDDPYLVITLPSDGDYTLAVGEYASCGTDLGYEVISTGISCDADGDGCNDSSDPHPNSIVTANVVIDGCDSGVANVFVSSDGCSTMSDLIGDCADNANNHGQFVSCVTSLSNGWKKDGLISGSQKGAIQSCASGSNLP